MNLPDPWPRRRSTAWVRCLAVACTHAAAPAQAAAPLAADDAAVLAARACEAELYSARLGLPGRNREHTFSTQLGCGLGHNTQASVAWSRSRYADAQNQGRRESLTLAGKTQMYRAPQGAALSLAAGSVMGRVAGEALHFDSGYITAVATAALGRGVTGHANLGWVHSRADSASTTSWNLALETVWRPGLDVAAEWYGDDRSRPWLGVGLRWSLTDQLMLGASYAVQADRRHPSSLSLGAAWAF